MKWNVKLLVWNAVIAALYAVLTISLEPISYGAVQFRLSEVMTLLAFAASGPEKILSPTFSPLGAIDVFVGSFATFLAIYPMRYCKNVYWASLLPTIANGIIIGIELTVLYQIPIYMSMASVAAGEFVVVSVIGTQLYRIFVQRKWNQSHAS